MKSIIFSLLTLLLFSATSFANHPNDVRVDRKPTDGDTADIHKRPAKKKTKKVTVTPEVTPTLPPSLPGTP